MHTTDIIFFSINQIADILYISDNNEYFHDWKEFWNIEIFEWSNIQYWGQHKADLGCCNIQDGALCDNNHINESCIIRFEG